MLSIVSCFVLFVVFVDVRLWVLPCVSVCFAVVSWFCFGFEFSILHSSFDILSSLGCSISSQSWAYRISFLVGLRIFVFMSITCMMLSFLNHNSLDEETICILAFHI